MIHGLTCFGETAIGELPSAYDLSTPNPLQVLSTAQASVFTTYCLVATPYNPTTAAETTVRLSNNGYRSFPTDTDANVYFTNALVAPYSARVSVISGGRLTGRATPAFGEVEIANPNGELDSLLDYNWDARDVTIYLGRKDQPFDSGFAPIFVGKVEHIVADLETIRLKLRSLDLAMDTPVQENLYMGIGWGLKFDGTDDEVSFGNNFDKDGTSDFTLEVLYRGTTTGPLFVFGKRAGLAATSAGYSLHIGAAGQAHFNVSDGTTETEVVTSGVVTDGDWHRLSCVYNASADTMVIYDDGAAGESASTFGSGSFSNAQNLTAGESGSGTLDLTGDLTDLRLWSVARSQSEILTDMHRTLSQSETGLAGYWPADEGTGTTLTDNIGAVDGTISGAAWIGTGEGGVELAGKPKPLVYGRVYGIEPVLIDPKNLVYQLHDGILSVVNTVRDGGVSLTYDGDVSDLWATTVASGDFKTDLTNGLIGLGAEPTSVLECDVTGDAAGGYVSTAGKVMRRIATRHGALTDPDDIATKTFTAIETDAPYTLGIATGLDPILRSELLDELAASVGGWWGFTRQGELAVGMLTAPESGTATATYTINDLELYEMTELAVPVPTYEQRVGYRRQWTPLRRTDLQTSVSGSDFADAMQELTQEYRYHTSTETSIQTAHVDAWSERTPTLIASLADAQTEADRRQTLYGTFRRLYRVPLVQGIYAADVGDIVCLVLNRFGLDDGQNFTVLGWEEDGSAYKQALILWGARPAADAPAYRVTVDGARRVTVEGDERITH